MVLLHQISGVIVVGVVEVVASEVVVVEVVETRIWPKNTKSMLRRPFLCRKLIIFPRIDREDFVFNARICFVEM